MWFSARSWNRQTQLELSWFQQSRKEGLDLMWIAQHEARVDTAIREVTAYFRKCRSLFHGRLVMVKTVTPDEPKKALKIEFFSPSSSLFRHYWTEQRIGDREGTGYAFGRASVSGGPALWRSGDGNLIIAPNTWRVEFPYGKVRYLSEYLQVPGVVSLSLACWSRDGRPKSWRDIVSMGYRDSYGLIHLVDSDNVLQATEDLDAPANWLLSALMEVEKTVVAIPERFQKSLISPGCRFIMEATRFEPRVTASKSRTRGDVYKLN